MKHLFRLIVLAAVAAVAFLACSKDGDSSESPALNKTSVTLMVSETFTLQVSNVPETTRPTFKTDNAKVATVSSKGVISAIGEGETDIHAVVSSTDLVCHVKVTAKPAGVVLIKGVNLGSDFTLGEGQTRQLEAAIDPANATGADEAIKTIRYASNNESVATVSSTGLVTAGTVPEGSTASARITATVTYDGKEYTGSVNVTVSSSSIPTTGITLSRSSVSLNPGATAKLEAVFSPAEHTDSPTVVWNTSDSGVATVNNGTVTAVNYGSAVITATIQGTSLSADCAVTVADGPAAAMVLDMSSTYFIYTWPDAVATMGEVSLEAWVNIGSSSAEQSFLGTEGVFLIRAQSDNYQAVTGGCENGSWSSANEVVLKSTSEAGVWHHVAAAYSASTGKVTLYVDGDQVAEEDSKLTGAFPMNGAEGYADGNGDPNVFMVGNAYGRNRFLQGNIAYARVWKKALTASEVAANMFKEDVSDGNLLAYWKFTEGSGDTVHDYSGNGRDLTPVSGSLNWVEGTLPAVK